jgi:hypothetical protein
MVDFTGGLGAINLQIAKKAHQKDAILSKKRLPSYKKASDSIRYAYIDLIVLKLIYNLKVKSPQKNRNEWKG